MAVPSCLPVTVIVIVIVLLPPGARVTLPVGAMVSTTATSTELAKMIIAGNNTAKIIARNLRNLILFICSTPFFVLP